MTPNLDPERVERAEKAISRMMPTDGGGWIEPHGHDYPNQYLEGEIKLIRAIARTAITAYLGDTHVVVPREPTVEMLAAAFPCEANEEFSHEDKVLGAAVCLKLGGGADIGLLEGEAVKQAAFLARDYRLMLSAAHPGKEG